MKGIRMELCRNLCSWRFIAGMIGIVAICLLSAADQMKEPFSGSISELSWYMFQYVFGMANYALPVVYLLAAMPGGASFCQDFEHGYMRPAAASSGYVYARNKTAACVISTFLTCFLGIFLFVAGLHIWNLLIRPGSASNGMEIGYYWEYFQGKPWLYYMVYGGVISLSAAAWSVLGLLASAFLPDRYVAFTVPLACNILLERLSHAYLPEFLDLYTLGRGAGMTALGFPWSILYGILVFVILILLFGAGFSWQVGRRLRNEAF